MLSLYQVFQQPIVPVSFLGSFLFLGWCFFSIKPNLNMKQTSWILTLISSLVCTLVSIPFVIQFLHSKLDMRLLDTDSKLHTAFTCFFISYLILDLSLGSIYYRERVTIMTGWIHHLFYIAVLFWFLRLQISSLFTVASILELPTVILAIGSMDHELRSDLLFGSTFFLLRLVAHAWMTIALKKYHRIKVIWIVALVIYPLHLYWFYGKLYILTSIQTHSCSDRYRTYQSKEKEIKAYCRKDNKQ